jgi:uncharacterized protein YdhG (YjbR/CyaY superfamily)
MKKSDLNVISTTDEYIKSFPVETQKILNRLRSLIQKMAPDAIEKISYKIPTFYLNGNLVHFAAYKNHIGFYPTASGISKFEADLREFKYAKGSIQFPIDKPLPIDLIKKIVKYRIEEARRKKKSHLGYK